MSKCYTCLNSEIADVFEELDPECRPFKMPDESVLRYVEKKRNIEIQRGSYVSSSFYNTKHPKGKDYPVFWSNAGNGSHLPLVELDGLNYVVGTCIAKDARGEAISTPIKIEKKGNRL